MLRDLLRDPLIAQARVHEVVVDGAAGGGASADADGFLTHTRAEEMKENLGMLVEEDSDEDDDGAQGGQGAKTNTVVSFQIKGELVENVKKQAIELDYPLSKSCFVHIDSCAASSGMFQEYLLQIRSSAHHPPGFSSSFAPQWKNMIFGMIKSIPMFPRWI